MPRILTLIAAPNFNGLSEFTTELCNRLAITHAPSWLHPDKAVDLLLDEDQVLQATKCLENRPMDFGVMPVENRRKMLLIADMDSTMIGQECIDELAAEVGLKDKVSAITAAAMRGDISFEPALRERVALLKGLPVSVVDDVIANRITLTPGGKTLVATMKKHGAYTALVSGGFTAFTQKIAKEIGFDENRANVLNQVGGALDGTVAEPILGREAKVSALESMARKRGISPEDAIAVGDGANDLGMIKRAGLGVAIHAKPTVAAEADVRIEYNDLSALLYLQGYKKQDWVNSV